MKKILYNSVVFIALFGVFFSNLPYYFLVGTIDNYLKTANIVDKFWNIEADNNVIDNLNELAQKWKPEEAQAATTAKGTVWFLTNTSAATTHGTTGPTSEQATATDITPAVPTLKSTALAMADTPGTAAVTVGGAIGSGVTWFRTFLSPKLAAQTIASGMTFNLNLSGQESSTSANAFTRTHVYVWREGTGKVATLIDGSGANCVTALEYATTGNGRACVTGATAANVTLQDGDQIAMEVWVQAVTGYNVNILYNGSTFVNHTVANTQPMSFFGTSRAVTLQTAVDRGSRWFLTNSTAATAYGTTGPTSEQATATDITPAVPTLKSTALAMKDTPGTAAVTVGGAIGSGVTWFRTFLSPKLAAQTINSGMTFNLNLSGQESSTSANAFTRTHVYVWREGTGKVATLIDGSGANCVTALEYATTGNGRACVTGATAANVTLQDGDQIAVEVWVQAVTGYTVNVLFNGSTFVNHTVANTQPMSFFGTSRTVTLQTAVAANTTLSTGTNPGDVTIGPGAAITPVNGFVLTTSAGTDVITAITVNLSTNVGVGTLTITNGTDTVLGSIGGGVGTGIVSGSNSIPITNTNATTGGTAFKVKVTPLSPTDVNMPAPPGGTYAITGIVNNWTGTNTKVGQATDTSSTVTIDNLSPNNATSVSGSAGNAANTINWTTSNSADFDSTKGSVVLRWTAASAGTEKPFEGVSGGGYYSIGDTIGLATVACVSSSSPSTAQSMIDGTGGSAGCLTAALTGGQAYTYKVFQRDTNANYDTGVLIGTFTPVATTINVSVTAGSLSGFIYSNGAFQDISDWNCINETECTAFKISATNGNVTVTSIKVTETGTVSANTTLSNPTLVYDTDANYSNGNAGNFGSVASFASDQTATFTNAGITIPSGSTYYFYIKLTPSNGTNYPVGGETLQFKIVSLSDVVSNASTDISTAPITLNGVRTVTHTITSYTNNSEGALNMNSDWNCTNCGARVGPGAAYRQTITINGFGFGPDPGLGSRDTINSKVVIGPSDIIVSDDGTANTNVTAWSNTAITIRTDSNLTGNTETDWGTNYGGAQGYGLEVSVNGHAFVRAPFYLFPQVTSITVPTAVANSAREYDATDSDGVITLNGTRFGSTGTGGWVRILGCDSSTCSAPSGSATTNSWSSSAIDVRVPTVIADNIYTGSIIMQQGTDSSNKSHTYTSTGFRILPRVTSLSPTSGTVGTAVTVNGNHLCENGGTCPSSFDTNNRVVFNSGIPATVFTSWSNTTIVTAAPSGSVTGNVYVLSNAYSSNNKSFTVSTPTPDDPISLGQYTDSPLTASLVTGSATNASNLYLTMSMSAAFSGGTLYPQIEYKPVGTAFSCTGTSACAQATEGTGKTGPGPVDCNLSASACAITITPTDNIYHWQARVRHNKDGADYYSNWVPFGANSESATDFQVDKTAPVISFNSVSQTCLDYSPSVFSNGVTISWDLSESAAGQIEYSKNSGLLNSTLSTLSNADFHHDISLNNLDSNTTYYYRVLATDSFDNQNSSPTSSPFCQFTTTSITRPAKTVKFPINLPGSLITGGVATSSIFLVHVPENSISIKSAFLEFSGLSSTLGTNNINISVNSQASKNYVISSDNNFFKVLYNIEAVNLGFEPTSNTFNLSPSSDLYFSSAVLSLTYSYSDEGCGECQYLSGISCLNYNSSTSCSTTSCSSNNYYWNDGTNVYLRSYSDVVVYCDGLGSCNSYTCASYSDSLVTTCGLCTYPSGSSCANTSAGTNCGGSNVCDGAGNCGAAASCPTGYVLVPGSATYGTNSGTYAASSGFCVAKYEMKVDTSGDGVGDTDVYCKHATWNSWRYDMVGCDPNNTTRVLVSSKEGYALSNISQTQAIAACSALGSKYHLINNNEWMTLARNIEAVPSNWTNNSVGSGSLYIGHSDSDPATSMIAGNDNEPYYGTSNSGDNQRRTFNLSNGNVVWDLSGNGADLTSGTVTASGMPDAFYDAGGSYTGTTWVDYASGGGTGMYINYSSLGNTTMTYNDLFLAGSGTYNTNQGVGRLYIYSNSAVGTTYAMMRSGHALSGPAAGILNLNLYGEPSYNASQAIAVRCVYVP